MRTLSAVTATALLLTGCVFNDDNAQELMGGVADPGTPPPPSPSAPKVAYCDSIVGNSKVTTSFSPGCGDCNVRDATNVADDVARSFASLSINSAPLTQGGAIRVTAQSGTVFPAGSKTGAYLTIPEQSGGSQVQAGGSNSLAIKTYLSGTLQEETNATGSPRPELLAISSDPELPESYVYFTTTKAFDAVELFISNSQYTVGSGGAQGTPAYKVYELCSDGGIR